MTDLSSEASASGATAGPGRLIRRAREQAGLSIEDLGAQIKLARGTLDALERDDFRTLSEPVYVRGYYRKLSKVLPVAEAELLSAYEAQVTPKSIPLPPSKLILSGETDLDSAPRIGSKMVIGVILIGLMLGGLAFWGSTRIASGPAEVVPAEPAPASSEAAPSPTSGLSSAEALAEPPADAAASAPATTTAAAPVSANLTLAPTLSLPPPESTVTPTPAPAPPATVAPTPAAAVPAPTLVPAPATTTPPAVSKPVRGRAEVQLQFSSTSWTRIEDATGKSLLSGVIQAGDRQTLSGEAPFSIFLGNAPGVSIQFNGQPVDMVKYTKGNNTARFTLP